MLKPAEDDAGDVGVGRSVLEPLLGLGERRVEDGLVLKALDVLHAVCVDPLKRLGELEGHKSSQRRTRLEFVRKRCVFHAPPRRGAQRDR